MNALANEEVGQYLNRHFVSAFQKVATFQINAGQKQGGNVAGYFCTPEGRVLHALETGAALELLIDKLRSTKSNELFLKDIAKAPTGG